MRFYFHPAAEREFDEAVGYYEQQQHGLGIDLAKEVYSAIARVMQFPESSPILSKNSRRCLVNRFPYGIIYQVKGEMLRIVAVANLHRKPDYWEERAEDSR
jgi:plasmid stabilization system protein ParE